MDGLNPVNRAEYERSSSTETVSAKERLKKRLVESRRSSDTEALNDVIASAVVAPNSSPSLAVTTLLNEIKEEVGLPNDGLSRDRSSSPVADYAEVVQELQGNRDAEQTLEVKSDPAVEEVLVHVNNLTSGIVFKPGYSGIEESSYSSLDKIALMVQNLKVPLIVEGCINTINQKGNRVDVNSKRIKIYENGCDVKELGLRRAEKVVKYLTTNGVGEETFLVPTCSRDNDPISNDVSKVATNRRCTIRTVTKDDLKLTHARKDNITKCTYVIQKYLDSLV